MALFRCWCHFRGSGKDRVEPFDTSVSGLGFRTSDVSPSGQADHLHRRRQPGRRRCCLWKPLGPSHLRVVHFIFCYSSNFWSWSAWLLLLCLSESLLRFYIARIVGLKTNRFTQEPSNWWSQPPRHRFAPKFRLAAAASMTSPSCPRTSRRTSSTSLSTTRFVKCFFKLHLWRSCLFSLAYFNALDAVLLKKFWLSVATLHLIRPSRILKSLWFLSPLDCLKQHFGNFVKGLYCSCRNNQVAQLVNVSNFSIFRTSRTVPSNARLSKIGRILARWSFKLRAAISWTS